MGVPVVEAASEAEAQCAVMAKVGCLLLCGRCVRSGTAAHAVVLMVHHDYVANTRILPLSESLRFQIRNVHQLSCHRLC